MLKICTWNAHSLQIHTPELKLLPFLNFHNAEDMDLTAITETWANTIYTHRVTGVIAAQSPPNAH
jgi:hypothetical protein